MGLTFTGLTLSQNFKNARIGKLHRACILAPIHFPDKEAESHGNSSSSNNEFSWWEVLLSITPKFSLLQMYACCVLSHFSHDWLSGCRTASCQAPLSKGFSKKEYWSGLPCPSPGDLPNRGIEPTSPMFVALQTDSLLSEAPRHPHMNPSLKFSV